MVILRVPLPHQQVPHKEMEDQQRKAIYKGNINQTTHPYTRLDFLWLHHQIWDLSYFPFLCLAIMIIFGKLVQLHMTDKPLCTIYVIVIFPFPCSIFHWPVIGSGALSVFLKSYCKNTFAFSFFRKLSDSIIDNIQ